MVCCTTKYVPQKAFVFKQFVTHKIWIPFHSRVRTHFSLQIYYSFIANNVLSVDLRSLIRC